MDAVRPVNIQRRSAARGPRRAAGLDRREFLKLGGAGLAGMTLLGPACGFGGGGETQASTDLEFTFWGSSFEKTAIGEMVQKWEQTHPEVGVEDQLVTGDYTTKMNTLIAGNNEPDVAYMGDSTGLRLAEQGKMVNVVDYFDEYPQLQDWLPVTYHYWAPDKALTNTAIEMMLIWYNKDLFEEAGVEPPPARAEDAWTWDEFVSAAERLTFDENGNRPTESGFDPKSIERFGVSLIWNYPPTWWNFTMSNGASLTNEAGTKYTLNSPEGVEVFQKLQDLIHVHHVAPDLGQMGNATTSAVQLQSKQVAMSIGGQWELLDISQSGLNYGMGVLPTFQEPRTVVLSGLTVVFTSSNDVDAGVEFLVFHNDPKHVDLFSNGLWMPLERKYYTDPEFIAQWTDNDAHPPEFKSAVIDYTLDYGEYLPTTRLKNYDKIGTPVLIPGTDRIWLNKVSAKEALDAMQAEVEPLLQGMYPKA